MSYKMKEELEAAEKEMVEHLKLLQDELGEKAYFGGEEVGYLDVILGGFCTWFSYIKTWEASASLMSSLSSWHGLTGAWRDGPSPNLSPTLTGFAISCMISEDARA